MAEKYIVTDKEGKEVWRLMAMSEGEACQVTADVKKVTLDTLKAEIDKSYDPLTSLGEVNRGLSGSTPILDKLSRKPRADKGIPRKEAKPEKAKRVRGGQFFICMDAVITAVDKDGVAKWLNEHQDISARIIQGRELKFERKVSFTLKPAK